jgi:hypothetical protein
MDLLTRPRRKRRLPRVPRFTTVQEFIENSADRCQKALRGLMLDGALRRSEVVSLTFGFPPPTSSRRGGRGFGTIMRVASWRSPTRADLRPYLDWSRYEEADGVLTRRAAVHPAAPRCPKLECVFRPR